jgi:hypothetical protein
VAAYGFNEGSGSTTIDDSSNANTGTLTNGPVWVAGRYGNGLSFDGVNDHVSVADNATLDLASAGTIEAWVRLETLNRWHSVIAKGTTNSDPAHNYALEVADNNAILCILGNGVGAQVLSSSVAMTAGVFRHLACSWDGIAVSLYIDGVLNASAGQALTPAGNTGSLFIGQFGGNSDHLDGAIDEVRIYNRTLTEADIQFDMSTPIQ